MNARDDDQEPHPDRHDSRSTVERLGLVERDVRSHARSLTALVEASNTFSPQQMAQMRTVLREELADAGLRIDGPEHVDDAREDFRFLRKLRKGSDGFASKIGWFIIAAILGGAAWLFTLGINTWKAGGGGP